MYVLMYAYISARVYVYLSMERSVVVGRGYNYPEFSLTKGRYTAVYAPSALGLRALPASARARARLRCCVQSKLAS